MCYKVKDQDRAGPGTFLFFPVGVELPFFGQEETIQIRRSGRNGDLLKTLHCVNNNDRIYFLLLFYGNQLHKKDS